jgi:hypothetical protein
LAKRGALLCLISGAHLLAFWLIDLGDSSRSAHRSEDEFVTIMLVDFSRPRETQPSTDPESRRSNPTRDPASRLAVEPDDSISPLPGIESNDARIDWYSEAGRVAGDVARGMGEEEKLRPLDQRPIGLGPLPPKPSTHRLGDSQRFEGGVIIDWVGKGCYYSNQDAHVEAFGPALRLQLPTCTGAGGGGGGKPLPTLEEWKKERDNR